MTDYGADVSTFAKGPWGVGLDPYGTLITGPRVVLECVARSWLNPLAIDVRSLIGAKTDEATILAMRVAMIAAAQNDERVVTASVAITVANDRVDVVSTIYLADGPFRLVLAITATTAEIIEAG